MRYRSIIDQLPAELRETMLRLVEAIEQDILAQVAARAAVIEQTQNATAELSGAYERVDQRLGRLENAVITLADALTEAQGRIEARLERLETAMINLAEVQQLTTEHIRTLAEVQERTTEHVRELAEAQGRMNEHVRELAET